MLTPNWTLLSLIESFLRLERGMGLPWGLMHKGFSSQFFGVGAWDCGVKFGFNRRVRDLTEL